MTLNIVSKIIEVKLANEESVLEKSFRNKLDVLYKIVHLGGRASMIEACALATLSNPSTSFDYKAVAGKEFCEEVVSIIDNIYQDRNTSDLQSLKDKLIYLAQLIDKNKYVPFNSDGKIDVDFGEIRENENTSSDFQFDHVSTLAAMILSGSTKNFLRQKVKAGGEVRNQLSKIMSSTLTLLDMLKQLNSVTLEFTEDDEYIPERFTAQRSDLTRNEIEWFILHHGSDYGIPDKDTWEIVIRKAPWLKSKLHTIINSLRRGNSPSTSIKEEILNIIGE